MKKLAIFAAALSFLASTTVFAADLPAASNPQQVSPQAAQHHWHHRPRLRKEMHRLHHKIQVDQHRIQHLRTAIGHMRERMQEMRAHAGQ